jgi:peptidoglycan/xylan/chitin deacetylase (PgdA/CDA1 family)
VITGLGPWEKRKPEWKQLAERGNELANHTVHHPCLAPQITPHLQDYTPAMMESEIKDAADQLATVVDRQHGLTFAYPCGNLTFGKPEDQEKNAVLYARYVSEYAFGARAIGMGAANPDDLNVLAVTDLGATAGKSFSALLDLAQPALTGHAWGVYCFHGVGGDWLEISPEALDQLAAYFESHPEVWTATFGDVLRYTQERKAASIRVGAIEKESVNLTIAWPLDKKIYDLPLTLKVEVPAQWKDVTASADGKTLNARIVDRTKGTVVLVDVPAQTASVRIAGKM